MTADRIPALLEPIQERLDAIQKQWAVQHKTFLDGDYDKAFESDWSFKPFTQESAMELAESMNRSKPVQIARSAFREVGEWKPEGAEDAPTDQARLLAAVQAVTALHKPERCWMPYEGAEVSYATEQEAIEAMEDCDLNQVAMQAIAENGTPFFEVCAECRRVENGPCEGECVREMGYLTSLWPCPTVAAVVAALGGEA